VRIDPRKGYQLMIDLINAHEGKVTLVVLGAQTDMALALQNAPEIKDKIEQIVIMGGAFHVKGNIEGNAGKASNDVAEWNIFVDASAAQQVFSSGVPLTIVPLDGSDNFWITKSMYDQIKESDNPAVLLLARLWKKQFEWWGGDFLLWDILAATAVVHPDLFTWECGELDVLSASGNQHGQTIVTSSENEQECFAIDHDRDELVANIMETYLR
jgi:inosine-uridine nucleoside N-ribohydrolase